MRSIAVSVAVGLLGAAVATWFFGWIAGLVPFILLGIGTQFFLTRRVGKFVEVEMTRVPALLQERKVDDARRVLEGIRNRWGPWQPLLSGAMDAQIGMLEYMQLHFDAALPLLKRGTFRNWMAVTAIGCIHWRKGDKAAAKKAFGDAVTTGGADPMAFVVPAVLLAEAGDGTEALAMLAKGVTAHPKSELVLGLQRTIANKGKIDRSKLPEAWLQFFPEDLARQMMVRGRKGGPDPRMPTAPAPKWGARSAPRR